MREAAGSSELEERVRHRAYELWEQAGRPPGRADEFWREAWAETEIEGGPQAAEPGEV